MKQDGVMVFSRSFPSAEQLPEAMKVYEEYCELLKKQDSKIRVELICAIENQMVWLEHWESREKHQAFAEKYIGLSDLPARMFNASMRTPEMHYYKPLPHKVK